MIECTASSSSVHGRPCCRQLSFIQRPCLVHRQDFHMRHHPVSYILPRVSSAKSRLCLLLLSPCRQGLTTCNIRTSPLESDSSDPDVICGTAHYSSSLLYARTCHHGVTAWAESQTIKVALCYGQLRVETGPLHTTITISLGLSQEQDWSTLPLGYDRTARNSICLAITALALSLHYCGDKQGLRHNMTRASITEMLLPSGFLNPGLVHTVFQTPHEKTKACRSFSANGPGGFAIVCLVAQPEKHRDGVVDEPRGVQ